MTATDSLPTQDAGGLSIVDWRLINAGEVCKSAAGVPRLGILPAHQNALVTGTSGMSYAIAAFNAITSRTGSGVEKLANDASATVSTTTAPASNSRIDVIWVRAQFVASADANNLVVLGVTQGTAAGSPTKPSIPAGALELATAVISSSTTRTDTGVTITQTFPYTAMAGGVVLLRSQTEQDAWVPADGAIAYRLDLDVFAYRENGAWSFEEIGTFTFGSLYTNSASYDNVQLRRRGKRAQLKGTITTNQVVSFAASVAYVLGTIPAGWRPASGSQPFRPVAISVSSIIVGWILMSSAGELQFAMGSAAASVPTGGILVGFEFEWELP
jgi:hypothetical protein